LLPASLVTIAITHVVAITVTIALVTVNRLPHLLPSLLLPKPSLSLSHDSTLAANTITRFMLHPSRPLRHPPPLSPSPSSCRPHPFRHMLLSLVDCFVFTFNVGWAVSQQVSQHTMI
jgi:hypothetical protein